MTYVKAVDNLMCLQCGWQPIKKEKVKAKGDDDNNNSEL
jgi:hypothetical protein